MKPKIKRIVIVALIVALVSAPFASALYADSVDVVWAAADGYTLSELEAALDTGGSCGCEPDDYYLKTDTYSQTEINNLISAVKVALKDELKDEMYPVGSIYMSVNPDNPGTYLGGEWEAWGEGRVPVGAGTYTDTQPTPETRIFTVAPLAIYTPTSGGMYSHSLIESQMPRHTHIQNKHGHTVSSPVNIWIVENQATFGVVTGSAAFAPKPFPGTIDETAAVNQYTGGTGSTQDPGNGAPHNNMQPYVTCYMWRRTA